MQTTGSFAFALGLAATCAACGPSASLGGPTSSRSSAEPVVTAPSLPGASAPPASSPAGPPADPPKAPPAPAGRPLPRLEDVVELRIEAAAGGPSQRRCAGQREATTLDLDRGVWTRGRCVDATPRGQPSPEPNKPLTITTGKLDREQRAKVEAAYSLLIQRPGPSCAADAGALRLKLVLRDGRREEYADPHSACAGPGETPPTIADDLRELHGAVASVTSR